MSAYTLVPLTSEERIRSYLQTDVNYAAYALGDLDPPYAQFASWLGAVQGSEIDGLALHYRGLDPPVLFLMGSKAAIMALLGHGISGPCVYYTAKPEAEPLLAIYYHLHEVHRMFRMRVQSATFRPSHEAARLPIPLDEGHAAPIMSLQRDASQTDGREWHDIAFAPHMLKDGYYYGIFDQGQLIAMAGTHVVAKRSRMAAVGNVVVHPKARGKGYGKAVSQAVTAALLADGYELIVLNVRQDNPSAIRIYEQIGYYHTGEFIEGLAESRPDMGRCIG